MLNKLLELHHHVQEKKMRRQVENRILPYLDTHLLPMGYQALIGTPQKYSTYTIFFGEPNDEIEIYTPNLNSLYLRVAEDKDQLFIDRANAELGLDVTSSRVDDLDPTVLPIYAARDNQLVLIYLAPTDPKRLHNALLFPDNLEISYEWLASPRERVHTLVNTWAAPTHAAMHRSGIDNVYISQRAAKWRGDVQISEQERFVGLIKDVTARHLHILQGHLSQHQDANFYNARYTFTGSKHKVVQENVAFVTNVMGWLMKMLYLELQSHPKAAVDWDSIRRELRLLGNGKNGSYLDSLSGLQKDRFSFVEGEGILTLVSDPTYLQERRNSIRLHNRNLDFYMNFQKHFADMSNSIFIRKSIRNSSQGYCPVLSETGAEQGHTFNWIVEIAQATTAEFFSIEA